MSNNELSSESSDSTEKVTNIRLKQYVASHRGTFPYEVEFNNNLMEAREAIRKGVYPQLISSGSSGSYFVRDPNGDFLAVFKPKDEEPFASLNPKWPKFFQRILCFSCFGRACLIPNNGYLSETAASIVDEYLDLDIVPKTRILRLYSPTFSYGRHFGRKSEPKPKEGSYQLFVHEYISAGELLPEWDSIGVSNVLDDSEIEHFTILFQKMCVLDYVIRNTDRHMDNWMIKHVPGVELKLAAIDNGLAFPVKHPEVASRFRQFPFGWATLSWAQEPWNEELAKDLLNLITPLYLYKLNNEVRYLFSHGNQQQIQMRVFRGQVWNLLESLRSKESPADLVKRQPVLVTRRRGNTPPNNLNWSEWYRVNSPNYRDRCCF
ncbi:Phosphatidylinositol 4-kinase type 2 [Aphelenchoides bicaudatus]|nr:Phosphatidylinositol 4-kinase type 2 [Aphelenchoides bicaudatus]